MFPTTEEWIIIAAILVIIVIPSKLGDLGDAIGRMIHGEPKA
jgi:Sec-independent protein translocase protein TatA